MDEQDDHWKDILNIAKSNKLKQQSPITELGIEKKAQLDANVLAHISLQFEDQQYNLASDQIEQGENNKDVAQKNELKEIILARLRLLKDQFYSIGRAPALALAALMAITFGLLINNQEVADPFLDVPDSLFTAGLEEQLVVSNGGQRALTSNNSLRRRAFVSGTIRADLDVVEEIDSSTVVKLIDNYPEYFADNGKGTQEEKLGFFQKQTAALAEDNHSKHWLQEGHLIELIRLASLSALDTFETDPLNTALEHFKKSEELENGIVSSDGLNSTYIVNRKQITEFTLGEEFSPDDIQRLVDLTQSLQVLVQ